MFYKNKTLIVQPEVIPDEFEVGDYVITNYDNTYSGPITLPVIKLHKFLNDNIPIIVSIDVSNANVKYSNIPNDLKKAFENDIVLNNFIQSDDK